MNQHDVHLVFGCGHQGIDLHFDLHLVRDDRLGLPDDLVGPAGLALDGGVDRGKALDILQAAAPGQVGKGLGQGDGVVEPAEDDVQLGNDVAALPVDEQQVVPGALQGLQYRIARPHGHAHGLQQVEKLGTQVSDTLLQGPLLGGKDVHHPRDRSAQNRQEDDLIKDEQHQKARGKAHQKGQNMVPHRAAADGVIRDRERGGTCAPAGLPGLWTSGWAKDSSSYVVRS